MTADPADVGPGGEEGSGLVELLVAALLATLGLAVLVAVVRGPLAAAAVLGLPRDEVEGVALAREVLASALREARSDADGPAVAAAGADHLVLRASAAEGSRWWRLSIVGGVVRVDTGDGPPPIGASQRGRTILRSGAAHLVVRDAAGRELAGPSVGPSTSSSPLLATAARVELHLDMATTSTVLVATPRP